MRKPAVAGQFYEGDRRSLEEQIEGCYLHRLGPGRLPEFNREGPRKIHGMVNPHAGYMYSGPVAAHGFSKLAEDGFPKTFVIFGPNHTGLGAGIALGTEDFETPLGVVKIDRDLTERLAKDIIVEDATAHRFEHSIEVQLPFLQHLNEDFKFVPICMGLQDYENASVVGRIVGEVIRGKDVVVIASTDFSHYIPKDLAAKKDKMAIDKILAMDAKAFHDTVSKHDISMCGYGPVTAMLTAVGEGRPEFLKYASSGDVVPMREVVGYCSIVVRTKS